MHAYPGGAVADRLTFNAWIGIVPPDDAAAEARKARLRLSPAKDCWRHRSRPRPRAVREAVGNAMKLRVDANAGDVGYRARPSASEPHDLQLLEQPVGAGDLAGTAKAAGHRHPGDGRRIDHQPRQLIAVIRDSAPTWSS